MVSAPDNLTHVAGRLLTRRPHPQLPDWELVLLEVQQVEPVPGRADLLSGRLGACLELAVPGAALGAAAPHEQLSLRARLTPRGVMAEAHPPPGTDQPHPE